MMNSVNTFEHWIGKRVRKNSGKPFKSRKRVATVLGVIEHPELRGKPAFVFQEDDSHVACTQVHAVWDDVIEQCEHIEHIESLAAEGDQ